MPSKPKEFRAGSFRGEVLVFKDIKNKRWTVWSRDKKEHLGYADELVLENCSFVVLEEKRQRVLDTGKRFPHAWVVGTPAESLGRFKKEIIYNPFKRGYFTLRKTGAPVYRRETVRFFPDGTLRC